MKEFCQNDNCENRGFKEVRVSVNRPGDQRRTLCAACEEAFSIGVQHGTITARQEPALCRIRKFLAEGFVVVTENKSDPSTGGPFEAWAYTGPLDFGVAHPVTFGTGWTVRQALAAVDGLLEKAPAAPGRTSPEEAGAAATLKVSGRELATILAALRYHQAENLSGGDGVDGLADQAIAEVATDGGRLVPLNSAEVDALCQRLNVSLH